MCQTKKNLNLHVSSNHAAKVLLEYGIESKNMLVECLWVEQSNTAAAFVGLPNLSGGGSALRIVSLPFAVLVTGYVQIFSKLNIVLKNFNL